MIKEFRAFLLRGNVIDLAVAVVIGAAFGAVVAALVKDLITPLIAAIFGKPNFSAIAFTLNNSTFLVGDFINSVVSFLLVALALFFIVVKPMQRIMPHPTFEEAPKTRECTECLTSIPVLARRCLACGQPQAPAVTA